MKQWQLAWTAVFLTLISCVAGQGGEPSPPGVTEEKVPATVEPHMVTSVRRLDDVIEVVMTGDSAVLDITSPFGIGGGTVALTTGDWPRPLTVRLHLAGLEQLQLVYGEVQLRTAVSALDGSSQQNVRLGNAVEHPIEPASPYWMEVAVKTADGTPGGIPLENGYFELSLPADFYESGVTQFTLEWVDFFR